MVLALAVLTMADHGRKDEHSAGGYSADTYTKPAPLTTYEPTYEAQVDYTFFKFSYFILSLDIYILKI